MSRRGRQQRGREARAIAKAVRELEDATQRAARAQAMVREARERVAAAYRAWESVGERQAAP